MATQDQRSNKAKQIKKHFDTILEHRPESYARTEDLGKNYDFKDAVGIVKGIQRLAEFFKSMQLENLPLRRLDDLNNKTENIVNQLRQIRSSGDQAQRDTLMTNLENAFHAAISEFAGCSFLSFDNSTVSELVAEARKGISEVEELVKLGRIQAADIESMLTQARDLSRDAGVTRYAAIFKGESDDAKKTAVRWFWGAIGASVCTVGIGSLLYWKMQVTQGEPIQVFIVRGITKIVLISFLVSVSVWASRIYRSFVHNSIVNKHRANALNAFGAFVEAASGDAQTKNAVLLQATAAIFNPQSSGFLGEEKEQSGTPQIIEVFKSISDKGGH